jgi:prolyl oligopeptidase
MPAWLASLFALGAAAATAPEDPFLWLEEVDGARAMQWVHAQNERAQQAFDADPRYEPLRRNLLAILDSRERIPLVVRMGPHFYNFWQDARNRRGIWRRVAVDGYRKAEPEWETVLDLDALAAQEKENWVWKAPACLRPPRSELPWERCLLKLSRGGADATVVREFDLRAKSFVRGGFELPEGKHEVDWADADHVWVGTDFGPGTLTRSGYARLARKWRRETPLASAQPVFAGQVNDVLVAAYSTEEPGRRRDWVSRILGVREQEHYAWIDSRARRLELPRDVQLDFHRGWFLLRLRSDWKPAARRYAAGSLLAIRVDDFLRGRREFDVLLEAGDRRALQWVASTRSAVLALELEEVRPRLHELVHDGTQWRARRVPVPEHLQIGVAASDWDADDYLLSVQGFTTPTTLHAARVGLQRWEQFEAVRSMPSFFDAAGLKTEQFEAVSRDGTRIPYFIVRREAAPQDGSNPTLLNGYGGFENSMLPTYSGLLGKGWLEAGGVLVRANIRGGGEFGPRWHRIAQREGRQKTFDDFIAVASDLIRRGVTRPDRLGIAGGSQGGLLVTGTLVQRPDLFGAAVAQVPLTDMLRYHRLLAGASWMTEYGDPDRPADRVFLQKYSPYQNLRGDVKYPRLFLVTSTRDDRVHPGHARKFAARMQQLGHDVLYFENIEGGHAAAADNEQTARQWAQTFVFLQRQLRLGAGP